MEIPGYQIQRKIGQGGMATVYLAIQESLDRPVVLKILDAERIESEQWTERFLIEGRLVASLRHPNIITIYDIGLADERLYISMEYIEGGDLKKRMKTPILASNCLDYLMKIGAALDAAHQHGIVHRDVKPANILFKDEHTPLLTDFGIAKQMDGDMDLTSTGIFLGSPNYVSPEQADGLTVDGRSDIYSLGCIFYEMLTGEKPFSSDSVIEIVIKHKQSPIPQFPEEYYVFQPLLDRMMAKKREDRFRDCTTMIEYISEIKDAYTKGPVVSEFDATVVERIDEPIETVASSPKKNHNPLLMTLLIIAFVINIILHFLEKSIALDDRRPVATLQSDIPNSQSALKEQAGIALTTPDSMPGLAPESASPAVRNALLWLGKQSLEEFKLTYPAKDNAYYYFSKLFEIEPDNQQANEGLLMIAERYAIQAEKSMADNDYQKARAYINIGLQIDPNNQSLHSVHAFIEELDDPSILDAVRGIFSSKKTTD